MTKLKITQKEIEPLISHYEMHKGELLQKIKLMLSFQEKWEDSLHRWIHRQLKIDEENHETHRVLQHMPEKKEGEINFVLKKLIAFREDCVKFEKEVTNFHKSLTLTIDDYRKLLTAAKKEPSEKMFNKAEYAILSVLPQFHTPADEILQKCARFDNHLARLIKKGDKLRLKAA